MILDCFHYLLIACVCLILKVEVLTLTLNLSFVILLVCFLSVHLGVQSIILHSHVNTPLIYQLSAAWSNHEGSLLVWCCLLSWCALWSMPQCYRGVQQFAITSTRRGWILLDLFVVVFFMCLLSLLTSNCFFKTPFVCFQSFHALNPVLQDILLAIHPPCIYCAYAASACAFCLSLQSKRSWKALRFWVTLCWCCLTFGIGLGSWWAYHELGWGGWWFWDPVENASLMPWLSVTATIHSLRFPRLTNWALITCELTFVCCICGTFLVRSGLLASVHSFASGGFWLIAFLCVVLLRTVCVWVWRVTGFEPVLSEPQSDTLTD